MVRFLARFQNDRVNFCEFKGGDSSVTDKCHFFKPKESSNTDSEVRYVAGLKLDKWLGPLLNNQLASITT